MADYKASTMPPNHKATVGNLQTFELPESLNGSVADRALGKSMIDAWKRDGILQISMDPINRKLADAAFLCSKKFFGMDYKKKAACLDDQSFAGYIASGEEITDNIADYSEIFTVTKDLALYDPRVQQQWPCHGPCPWPFTQMKTVMQAYMDYLGESGEKMLQLIAWGLGMEDGNALTRYTQDGWHHMRILRFPETNKVNGKGKAGRGIGSHTDYGLLVIAAQDDVGGLFIRPPIEGETYANWKESAAGKHEDTDGWVYVPPVPDVFTVFPGDMMQYITNSFLPSTPHKVGLNTRERFAFAYFHEPNFSAVMKPLPGFEAGQEPAEGIHYGSHFTNMFMRNYPERITADRMRNEGRLALLDSPSLRWKDTPVVGGKNVASTIPVDQTAEKSASI
ncbi:2-oxoglutarate-dependent ethylene/succinate-forming enzyme [Pyrenophora tritici-repentis]|uniref:2-oxoglutarate-dependent ethylene/succinate-forming enzyme n=2 Tax=Pyrenophora tritici-repentis TaxID=45151 RepID=A0A2W1GQB5_9PLEO|nr:2-oxoglutarate-dependent ethylene/succinate-forming enzyme [Pyrenophora tritici-repentis Pt-1C-BFP]KAA8611779.1 2-oxoglutarate-dependent ethylene/succinate-forming enzyme [Pyrenophora tritici-repentis]EDU47980.1 2-oxoglutarate-dependent ethylene/succinate-forming enzyme [Pyrenophora tritici-repentis Pt-1C-BFP]KAF7447319.1 2-oxoglutarate-dependent ethylene/succinate-forming enzyme [Pyrenophora tritici-repentis]KAF7569681.1 2OG-FeII-Oxy multi-domain protein [Pyrenophora tritici-repentis]KAI05